MDRRGIAEGMTVRARDGKKLGKVIECAEESFVVEKGLFFPKDYSIRYDQIVELRDGEVYLNVADVDLGEAATANTGQATASSGAAAGPLSGAGVGAAGTPAGAGMSAAAGAALGAESREAPSAPGTEEEVEIRKRPALKEEVRGSRDRRPEERRADAEVDLEAARIEGSGELEGRELERGDGERSDLEQTRDFEGSEGRPRSEFDEPER